GHLHPAHDDGYNPVDRAPGRAGGSCGGDSMTALRNIAAIVQKEWRHYFGGPTAYVVVFVCTLLFGLFFCLFITMFIQQGMRMMGGGAPIGEGLIQPLIENMTITAMFLMPMLTMRLFAEEKRLGTMEL